MTRLQDKAKEALVSRLRDGSSTAAECLALARAAAEMHEAELELEAYQAARLIDPSAIEAHRALARRMMESGEPRVAALVARAGLIERQTDLELRRLLMLALGRIGDLEQAANAAVDVLALDGEDEEAERTLARCISAGAAPARDPDIVRPGPATAVDPVEAALTVASREAARGKRDAARAHLRTAMAGMTPSASAWVRIGDAHADLGFLEDAIRCFERAVRLDEDFGEAHLGLGRAQLESKLLDEALSSLTHATVAMANPARAHYHLSRAYRAAGDGHMAAVHLARALAMEPDDPEIQQAVSIATQVRGQEGEAVFSGELSAFPISELLDVLSARRVSGCLRVEKKRTSWIWILRGEMVWISEDHRRHPQLIDFRAPDGNATKEHFEAITRSLTALDAAKETAGFNVSQRHVHEVVEMLEHLIGESGGEFSFHPIPLDADPGLKVDTRFALLEAHRRIDEGSRAR